MSNLICSEILIVSQETTILSAACVVGAINWAVESQVIEVIRNCNQPKEVPELREKVISWAHGSIISCHRYHGCPTSIRSFPPSSGRAFYVLSSPSSISILCLVSLFCNLYYFDSLVYCFLFKFPNHP